MVFSNLVGGDTPSVHAEFPPGVPSEFKPNSPPRRRFPGFDITRPNVTDRVSRSFREGGC